jgi:hypothetical protein
MDQAKQHASTILREYHQAEVELVGKAVVLSDGKAGTIEAVFLDELHGLRLSIAGDLGKWPVSRLTKAPQPNGSFKKYQNCASWMMGSGMPQRHDKLP